ncbi:hypothetical protein QA601_02455 [Chitinispirillales bacterium ANBcel5]|uniref:hypothetical protein n=1 Tax=Cellulosispirillum alkaliphilum TaxID=3039283 RepID=UPI002A5768DD|nr:hypothetical protein [Chitinispirillales bacterium ANBcel5]
MTASKRKRATDVGGADTFETPQVEHRSVPVPEAELEHVGPVEMKAEDVLKGELPKRNGRKKKELRNEIMKRLESIEKYEGQVTETILKIEDEKNCIKNLVDKLI